MSHYAPSTSHRAHGESSYHHRPVIPAGAEGRSRSAGTLRGPPPLQPPNNRDNSQAAEPRRVWCACAQRCARVLSPDPRWRWRVAPAHPRFSDEEAGTRPAQLLCAQHGPIGTGRAGRTRLSDATLMCREGVACGRTRGRDTGPTARRGGGGRAEVPTLPSRAARPSLCPTPQGRCWLREHRDLPVGTGLVGI